MDRAVDLGEERHCRAGAGERDEELLGERHAGERSVAEAEIRSKVRGERAVGEGRLLGERVEGEVERIDGSQLERKIDGDLERGQPCARPGGPGYVVPGRVVLPADLGGIREAQRVALEMRAGMRRGPQPDEVRSQDRRPRIDVAAAMVKREAHPFWLAQRGPSGSRAYKTVAGRRGGDHFAGSRAGVSTVRPRGSSSRTALMTAPMRRTMAEIHIHISMTTAPPMAP